MPVRDLSKNLTLPRPNSTFPHLWFRGDERFPKIDLDPAGIAPALQPGPLSGTRRHFVAITEADVDKTVGNWECDIGHSLAEVKIWLSILPKVSHRAFRLLGSRLCLADTMLPSGKPHEVSGLMSLRDSP